MNLWRTTEVRALRQMAGSDAMTVAAALGRTPRAVQDMARRQGTPVPRQQHVLYWPTATKRRARSMRASGHTVNQISAALGVPFGTVRRWVYEGVAA